MSAQTMEEADRLDRRPRMESCFEVIQDSFSVLHFLGEGHLGRSHVASAFLSLQLLDGSLELKSDPGEDPMQVSLEVTSGRQGVEIGCHRRHWGH